MPSFIAFANGEFLNLDQVREITITDAKNKKCVVTFSERESRTFTGDAYEDLIDVVTQLMLAPPTIQFIMRKKREDAAARGE
jgi:hypothetical protein